MLHQMVDENVQECTVYPLKNINKENRKKQCLDKNNDGKYRKQCLYKNDPVTIPWTDKPASDGRPKTPTTR